MDLKNAGFMGLLAITVSFSTLARADDGDPYGGDYDTQMPELNEMGPEPTSTAEIDGFVGIVPPAPPPPSDDPPPNDDPVVTVLPDGAIQIYYPATGHTETTYPDGTFEIKGSSGNVITDYPDGATVTSLPDGESRTEYPDGSKVTNYPDGSYKENYPDGTIKITYPDGHTITYNIDGTVDKTPPKP